MESVVYDIYNTRCFRHRPTYEGDLQARHFEATSEEAWYCTN
jgi:hypothetical protein